MKITFGIVVNPRKEQVRLPLNQLEQWIDDKKPSASFILCDYDSPYTKSSYKSINPVNEEQIIEQADILLTLGGDGTILRTVQVIGSRSIPILGVNLGGLGFLADTPPDAFIEHIESFIDGHYILEERAMLQCRVNEGAEKYFAFNDMVIDKAGFSRVIEIITRIDGHLLNSYIADALILSTPSGSTGYSLSAGGPIVIPQTEVLIINPICPHSLTNRPVVVPNDSIITLKVSTEHKEVNLFRDGQLVASLPSGTRFEFTKSPYKMKLVKMKEREFFEILRSKLHWGEDFRDKNRWSYMDSNGS